MGKGCQALNFIKKKNCEILKTSNFNLGTLTWHIDFYNFETFKIFFFSINNKEQTIMSYVSRFIILIIYFCIEYSYIQNQDLSFFV